LIGTLTELLMVVDMVLLLWALEVAETVRNGSAARKGLAGAVAAAMDTGAEAKERSGLKGTGAEAKDC
jgi:hypothetical protein